MPLHWMGRQTFLGWLFLAVGLVLIALACSPIVIGLAAHPRVPVIVSWSLLAFLGVGIGVAVFGAWLLPSSGAPAAASGFVAVFGPFIPRIPGLSRIGDPKPPAPPVAPPALPALPIAPVAPPSDSASHEP